MKTMISTTLVRATATLALAVLFTAEPAPWSIAKQNSSGPLDGKTFTVRIERRGEALFSDTLSFSEGRFLSAWFAARGFDDALYVTTKKEKALEFVAIPVSDDEGEVHWHGTVRGGSVSGYLLWKKPGEKPVLFTFFGRAAPPEPGA